MKASDTIGAQVKRAWRAPRGMKVNWLVQMTNSRKPAHSKAGERQRAHDVKAVAKMNRQLAKHQREVRKYFRAQRKESRA
jgi:hypothetical protein